MPPSSIIQTSGIPRAISPHSFSERPAEQSLPKENGQAMTLDIEYLTGLFFGIIDWYTCDPLAPFLDRSGYMGHHLYGLSKIITFALALYDMIVDFAGRYIILPTQRDLQVSFVISSSPCQIMSQLTAYLPLYQDPDQLHLHCAKTSSEHLLLWGNHYVRRYSPPTHQEQTPRHAPKGSSYPHLRGRSAIGTHIKRRVKTNQY